MPLTEPEASLHPDLIEPLARLIVDAAADSQIWVSTHSQRLAEVIRSLSGVEPVNLQLTDNGTVVV